MNEEGHNDADFDESKNKIVEEDLNQIAREV
jgi:hypothetical protein